MELLLEAKKCFYEYFGTGFFLPLFLLGILFILLCRDKRKSSYFMAFASVVIMLISALPPCVYIIDACIGIEVYWRMYWLLPVNALIAYLFVETLPAKEEKITKKLLYGVIAICVLCIAGEPVFTKEAFTVSENAYEIPQETIDLIELIEGSAQPEEEINVIFPPAHALYARTYSGRVNQMYGRKYISPRGYKAIAAYENADAMEASKTLVKLARRCHFNYVVYYNDPDVIAYFQKKKFTYLGNAGIYAVFKREL